MTKKIVVAKGNGETAIGNRFIGIFQNLWKKNPYPMVRCELIACHT
jgi:hypothetical protein